MDHRESERVPFDERASLEELERFRQSIEQYRAQRKALGEEFEQFVHSFKTLPDIAAPRPTVARATPPDPITSPVTAMAKPMIGSEPAAGASSPATTSVPAKPVERQSTGRAVWLLGGAVILTTLIGVATWTFRPGAPGPSPAATAPAIPAAIPSTAPEPPKAAATSPQLGSELTTTRPVWVRVLADGERVLERELPADAKVALKAERTIVIRTGDAGAVRLTIAGQDQGPLGRAGEVVTRTFTVPDGATR